MSPDTSSTIQRLQTAFDDARQANARKDRFIAVAAHELRQPLAALMLQAETLRRMGMHRKDDHLEELGCDLRSTARRQARLICDLVDVARARNGKLELRTEDIEVGTLVRRVVTGMAMAVPSVGLHLHIGPPECLVCRVDGVRVEQIISNLMENALKFTGPGGHITVRVSADDGLARISIADTGRGIASDALGHLFDGLAGAALPGDPCGSGMGIGLTLVHELVEAHAGRVSAHSDGPGLGAEFTVWLPLRTQNGGIQANHTQNRFNTEIGTLARQSP